MAELATSLGVIPITINATGVDIPRGYRVTRNSSNLFAATADQTTRGDCITQVFIPANKNGAGTLATTGKCAVVFDGAIVIGALVYASTTAGQCSPTSGGGALVMGRCTLGASGAGVLGEVQLFETA